MMPSADTKITELEQYYGKDINLGLERITALLSALGNPEKHLPPTIHITGTNGKGSTLAFIKAMCEAEGLSVHSYTSPHFVHWRERITLAGKEISDELFISLLTKVDETARTHHLKPSIFELITATAFLAFSTHPADILLLEVGMGGRLDATNAIEKPLASIITSVSLDHTAILGDTIAKIATEKVGIFKGGSIGIVAPTSCPEVFIQSAKAHHLSLFLGERDFSFNALDDHSFSYNGEAFPAPSLAGCHQYENAALAITCAREVLHLSEPSIRKGLSSAVWQGRLQKLEQGYFPTLIKSAHKNIELWLDGGHNEGAARALATFLPNFKDKPLYAICGMLTTKDAKTFFDLLAPFFTQLYLVPIEDNDLAFAPTDLQKLIGTGTPATSFTGALNELISTQDNCRILLCGSLYLLGNFLKENQKHLA